jgi:hypothetical protein
MVQVRNQKIYKDVANALLSYVSIFLPNLAKRFLWVIAILATSQN